MDAQKDPALNGLARRGLMMVLSSPSGAGKTTLSRRLLDEDKEITLSISATTRAARGNEKEGRDYFFMDKPQFDSMVARDELLEHALVFGHHYGTPRAPVEEALASGRDVLFDIDWQGTQQLAEKARGDLVSVFILPPSWEELERRLFSRAADTPAEINNRMAKAVAEMSHWSEYDYVIVNGDLEASVRAVKAILQSERLRRARLVGLPGFVQALSPPF